MAKNSWISNLKQKWENLWYVPVSDPQGNPLSSNYTYNRAQGGSQLAEKNLSNILAPINIPRVRQDVQNWRLAISESERMILPFRYKMQQMYLDTALDPQITACVERRKNLTLLRQFEIVDNKGNINEEWTEYLNKNWFKQFMNYSFDALFFGYSLVAMGDIVNNEFTGVTLVRRGNISPDRLNVAPVPYDPAGVEFTKEPYSDFHIWVTTPNDHGMSNCGYGLYYVLTPFAIYSKNNLSFNIQYNELFGMPLRQLKTNKKDGQERDDQQTAMDNMGSMGYIITDTDDELLFHTTGKSNGYAAYTDLENRLNQAISKIILGHADALDSTPGKLGGGQGGDMSPQASALRDIQSKDGDFIAHIVNEKLFNLIRNNGIPLPKGLMFRWSNDAEDKAAQGEQNIQNKLVADYLMVLKKVGFEIEEKQLKELTGLDLKKVEVKEMETSKKPGDSIENMLNEADIPMHYGCRCDIDKATNTWVTVPGACNDCEEAADVYNTYISIGDIENAMKVFSAHSGKELS